MAQQSLTPRQARKSCESRVPPFIVPYYLEGKTCKDCLDESSWYLMHSVLWGAYVWWNTLRRFVIKSDDVWWYLNILGHLYIVFIYIHIHDHKAIRYVMILYVDIVISMDILHSFGLHVLIFMSSLIRNLLFCDRHMVRICQWSRKSQELESATLEWLKAVFLILHGRWIIFKVISWDEQPSLD